MCLLFDPMVGNYLNLIRQREEIAGYREAVEAAGAAERARLWEEAERYNGRLRSLGAPLAEYEELGEAYRAALDVDGTGILGYVGIPGIGVELPISHGTEEETLKRGAGHLEGTSLPVGGESTHAVLSAHRGLPGAKLFTELDRVKEGDLFTVTVLGRELVYEVDLICVVEPEEMEVLNVEEGKDYVTLMTCTPYGINSHRLLVRGKRAEREETAGKKAAQDIPGMGALLPAYGVPVLFTVLFTILLFHRGKAGGRRKREGRSGDEKGRQCGQDPGGE